MRPTEKQLRVINIIEKNLSGVVFQGLTIEESSKFISENITQSKAVSSMRRISPYDSIHRKTESKIQLKSDEERYEEYIRSISGVYDEADGDDGWGGFGGRELAKKLHPFDQWKWLNK